MSARHKHCQSCGMPIKHDEQGGGSEADGSKSAMYCSHSYDDGAFIMPEPTAAEMQLRVGGRLREFGFPGFMMGFLTRGIPRLARRTK